MRITIVVAILAVLAFFLSSCDLALAQVSTPSAEVDQLINSVTDPGALEVGQSSLAPTSPLYFFKALREYLEMMLAGNSSVQAQRQLEFSLRRLRETNKLVSEKKEELIVASMEEYNSHLDQAIQLAGPDEQLLSDIAEAIARHLYVLQNIFDKLENPRAKIAVRAALIRAEEKNTKILARLGLENQQKLIRKIAARQAFACKFLIKEASSSSLNDSEKVVLGQKVADCKAQAGTTLKDELMELNKSMGSSTYSCPPGEWIDCIPIVGKERQSICSSEYLSWAKANCPNFKGAAY